MYHQRPIAAPCAGPAPSPCYVGSALPLLALLRFLLLRFLLLRDKRRRTG